MSAPTGGAVLDLAPLHLVSHLVPQPVSQPVPQLVLLGAVLAAGAAWAAALAVLVRRGDAVPLGRSAAAAGGLVAVAVALVPPVASAGGSRGHVVQHLLVGMLAPVLLAVSAPVALALRTLPGTARRALLALLRSRVIGALTWPGVVLVLDTGALYALHLSGLGAHLHHSPVLRALVLGHMLAAGTLFAAVVVQADPVRRRLSTPARLALLVTAAAAHDVLATLLYASAHGVAGAAAADVRAGAELMRSGGALVHVLLACAVMAGWYARTGRELARADRRAERTLLPPTV